jgi:hypothetical protein
MALSDAIRLGAELRTVGQGANSMEEVASRIARHLYARLVDDQGNPANALVRVYKSHRYGALPASLQDSVRATLGEASVSEEVRCLTLLGTAGSEAAWNHREQSAGHRAIPLPSEGAVERLPMILQLVRQLGLEVSQVVRPQPALILELDQATFNVFFVERARGSEHIPAQDNFVIPYAIQSVLGFGGMLPSGDMFAVIAFSKVALSRATADLFKTMALNVKLALLPFTHSAVFS